MLIIHVGHFGHQEEGSSPSSRVDLEVLDYLVVFLRGADPALNRDSQTRRLGDFSSIAGPQTFVAYVVQGLDEFAPLPLELIENRSQQLACGRECVATAIEAGFDSELRHPQATFGEELALDEGGSEVADFEDDLLSQFALVVWKEVVELGQVAVETGVEAG